MSTNTAFSFNDFRAKLKDPGAAQLMRELKVVISEFSAAQPEAEENERVVEALGQLEQRMLSSSPWQGASDEICQSSREGLEKYLMTAIHGRAWLPSEHEAELDRQHDVKQATGSRRRSGYTGGYVGRQCM